MKRSSTDERKAKTSIPIFSLLLFLVAGVSGNVAADDYDDYARAVKKEVWSWNKPEFENRTLPNEYRKESAVVLAHHEEIKALSKNRIRVNPSLFGGSNWPFYFMTTNRQMVRINDRVALEKYSELSFKEEAWTQGVVRSDKYRSVVGIRIIKPDGSVREVDINDEAVAVMEHDTNREMLRKLAVPGLQVGDVIDYFFCSQMEVENQNAGVRYLPFYGEYPVLSYSVHCEISRKLTVEYASMNGAPDFVRSTNRDKDVVLDVVRTNLPKILPSRWTSAMRDLPAIRMNVLNNNSRAIYKPQSARKAGVYKRGENLTTKHLLDDAVNCINDADRLRTTMGTGIWEKVKKAAGDYRKHHPGISQEDLADYIYDALHFYSRSSDMHPVYFFVLLRQLLKDFKIPGEYLLAVDKYGARMSDMVSDGDPAYGVGINGRRCYFYPYFLYRTPRETPGEYQGEEACVYASTAQEAGRMKSRDAVGPYFRLPETQAEDNLSQSVINVSFAPDDPAALHIDRRTEYSGALKPEVQRQLGTYEEWDREMRRRLQIGKTLEEELKESRNDRRFLQDMKAVFDRRKNDRNDSVKLEIERFHARSPRAIFSYELSALGIAPDRPNVSYSVSYSLDSLVTKSGNDLILSAGRLIGSQWMPDSDGQRRHFNAYLPTARMFAWQIEIRIPDNCRVQGIEQLNVSRENEYASFRSTASLTGNRLTINAGLRYRRAFVPVAEWSRVVDVTDVCRAFCSRSVVLSLSGR
jgi:hypothetical protein